MSELKKLLHDLYDDASKHSVYQSVPDFVTERLGYIESIDEGWRGDRPRLRFLFDHRTPAPGEHWGDFGANTGFFILSLAHKYPSTHFTAIEANPNHAHFIEQIAKHFDLENLDVQHRAVGMRELHTLPNFDFLLHLNVLHHAGHDFDRDLVPEVGAFPPYASRYLSLLHEKASELLLQLGSNWGGDKATPWIGSHQDEEKLQHITEWLSESGWIIGATAYPVKTEHTGIHYMKTPRSQPDGRQDSPLSPEAMLKGFTLDDFPGEFYRRPLFLCRRGPPTAT